MNIHLATGWGFRANALSPLAYSDNHLNNARLHDFRYNPETLRENTRESWVLAGWSLGGIKALAAVGQHLCTPIKLVTISASARFCASADYTFGVNRAALRAMMAGLRRNRAQTLARFYRECAAPLEIDEPSTLAALKQADEFTTPELQAGLSSLDELDVREHLSRITIPVLLLHGKCDRIIPVEAAEYLADNLPAAKLVIHPEAGHDLPVRYPEWVAGQMQSFMR